MRKIIVDPKVCNGQLLIVEGTEVSVAALLQFLAAGDSVEDLLEAYPALTQADVRQCLAYSAELLMHPVVLRQITERNVVIRPRPPHARVKQVQSAVNIRQLLQAILLHVDRNQKLPELADLQSDDMAHLWRNPLRPEQQPAYIHIKPTVEAFRSEGNDQRPMIHENYDGWPGGINIGFVDGHVDWILDQQYAERLIRAARNP